MSPSYDPKDVVYHEQYLKDKNCTDGRLEKLELAMFGQSDLEILGVLQMTKEMYNSVMTAKAGQKIFWAFVGICGSIITMFGAWKILNIFHK
jgi:hypothetical protein